MRRAAEAAPPPPCNQVALNIPHGSAHTLIGHSFSPSSSQLCMAPRAPVIVRNTDGCWLGLAASQGFEVQSLREKCFLVGIDYLSLGLCLMAKLDWRGLQVKNGRISHLEELNS